uniref:Ras-GEF domain-containing protein n=1 Tax=Macrostomum lignano TaxID=282301 RepID=A0A1I8FNR9_9PLAT
DFAREITLVPALVFTSHPAGRADQRGLARPGQGAARPNVVKFTRVFNHVNFWVQKCILETTSLSNRATVLAHFIKIAKKLYELQNLHGTFAVVAALQSQPIFRLKKTWSSLPRKHVEAFERLSNSNHERLRRLMQDIRQPVIPYLGLYMNDLVYIDTCHPSTGGLESQARKDKMNKHLRVLSDYQQSQYSFQSKEHVRRYLEGQTYIEEMQSFVEAANYKTSRDLEPPRLRRQWRGAVCGRFWRRHPPARLAAAARKLRAGPPGPSGQSGLRLQTSAGHRKSKSFSDARLRMRGHPGRVGRLRRSLGQLSSCQSVAQRVGDSADVRPGCPRRASVAPNRQNRRGAQNGASDLPGRAPAQVVYKSGRKQTRSSYVRFWAELSPADRLYAAAKPFASDRREDFKRQCKKQQDLSDASVVVFENTSQCSDPEHTFQINFDLSDRVGQLPAELLGGKFCSYKYRVSPGSRRQTRDFWVAQIKRAIQQSKRRSRSSTSRRTRAEAGAAAAAPSGVAGEAGGCGQTEQQPQREQPARDRGEHPAVTGARSSLCCLISSVCI